MLTKDKSLNPKIIKAAQEEFYKKGYKQSTLRSIADLAGVTTGAIYTRYKDKNTLFYALCKETIEAMEQYFTLKDEQKVMIPLIFSDLKVMKQVIQYHLKVVLENVDGLELLLFKSEGSKYQNYRGELISIYQIEFAKWMTLLVNNKSFYNSGSNQILLKNMATFYISYIEEIIIHKNDMELVEDYTDKIASLLFVMFQSLINNN